MADQNSSNGGSSGRRNPADNLTREHRVRGGERSAAMQNRDSTGQFAGRKGGDRAATNRPSEGPGRNASR